MLWLTLRRLKSTEPETRKKAIEKLADSRDSRVVQPLIDALNDSASDVRWAALVALDKVAPHWTVSKKLIAMARKVLGDHEHLFIHGLLAELGKTNKKEVTGKARSLLLASGDAKNSIAQLRRDARLMLLDDPFSKTEYQYLRQLADRYETVAASIERIKTRINSTSAPDACQSDDKSSLTRDEQPVATVLPAVTNDIREKKETTSETCAQCHRAISESEIHARGNVLDKRSFIGGQAPMKCNNCDTWLCWLCLARADLEHLNRIALGESMLTDTDINHSCGGVFEYQRQ